MKSKVLLLAASLLLGGCTSLGVLDKNVAMKSDKDSIFVIGVAPDNYRISVFPGNINKDGKFVQNPFSAAAIFSAADHGYVVGKAKAGDILAITNIRVVKSNKDLLGPDFAPCNGLNALTFTAAPGKVTYIGDVSYRYNGSGLNTKYSENYEAAKSYIDSAYPNLRGRLEAGSYKLMPTTIPCKRTITVFVPRYN